MCTLFIGVREVDSVLFTCPLFFFFFLIYCLTIADKIERQVGGMSTGDCVHSFHS